MYLKEMQLQLDIIISNFVLINVLTNPINMTKHGHTSFIITQFQAKMRTLLQRENNFTPNNDWKW